MTNKGSHSNSRKQAIKDARGALEGELGGKPFPQWWADYKKEEKAFEEAKYARLRPR